MKKYDVIISGAGPAGATCATFLAPKGHKVLLLEKETFPRDKICGDAISGFLQIQEDLNLTDAVKKNTHAEIRSVTFSAPNGKALDIHFKGVGYCCRRVIYDNIIFQCAQKEKNIDIIQNFKVTGIVEESGKVIGVKGIDTEKNEQEFRAKIIVGADGAYSVVAKETGLLDLDPKHTLIAVKSYYKNVKNMTGSIELHFVNDILPGYFWIFPMGNNEANVGLGISIADYKKKNWKLAEKMADITEHNPLFKERFEDAELEEGSVKTWALPVGSKRRKAHGHGFILIGDAAGLIDPFTGEGISNSMKSGETAVKWIDKALKENNVSEAFLKQYEDEIWDTLGKKLKTACKMQKLGKIKFLVNLVLNKCHRSQALRDTLRLMVDNSNERKNLTNPWFYLKLLFS